MRPSPILCGITADGGIHRRCTPEVPAGALSWLGEPMSEAQARRYEVHRLIVMRSELDGLVARHSIAEGSERAALAEQIADLHVTVGGATP